MVEKEGQVRLGHSPISYHKPLVALAREWVEASGRMQMMQR